MFYRTQIKAITDFGVVDMAGKKLRFVGYLPVKAGDFVFTDGTFIFGNVPPRGSPATFGEDPPGVPVLGDDLRGYFSRNGIFKNYPVKQDTWLVNSDKKFAHGSEDNVIDAELADDGSLLTVEKNPVQVQDDEQSDSLFYYYVSGGFLHNANQYYTMLDFERDTYGRNTQKTNFDFWWLDDDDFDYIKSTLPEIIQAVRRTEATPFISHQFIPREENKFVIKDCELIIKKDGNELKILNLSELVQYAENYTLNSIDFSTAIQGGIPYLQSRANLLNFKILPDASWSALIEIEIGAEWDFPRDDNTAYESGVWSTMIYYRRWLGYTTSAVHSLIIFKVNSAGEYEIVADRSIFMPLWLIDYTHSQDIVTTGDKLPFEVNPTTFPYTDLSAPAMSWSPDEGYHFYWSTFLIYDSRVLFDADYYLNEHLNTNIFSFPVQNNFQAHFINTEDDINKWTLGGIVDAQNQPIIGAFLPDETDAHTWNMGCASLNGGSYLFGIHDKALYKIDRDANISLVGDNLKNFRLRELKKISKSRR